MYYRRMIQMFVIYMCLALLYLGMIPESKITTQLPFLDFYLFLVLLIIYSTFIYETKSNALEMIRFSKMSQYIQYKWLQFTKWNVCMMVGLVLLYVFIFTLKQVSFNILILLSYIGHLFVVFEIFGCSCICLQCVYQKKWIVYIISFLYLCMFCLYLINENHSYLMFNIFSGYFLQEWNIQTIINLCMWFIVPWVLCWNRKDQIEI